MGEDIPTTDHCASLSPTVDHAPSTPVNNSGYGNIIKQGFLHMKRPPTRRNRFRFRAWRTLYVVIRDKTSKSDRVLEIALDKSGSKKASPIGTVSLSNIVYVGPVKSSTKYEHAFMLVIADFSPLLLACDTNIELLEWVTSLKLLSHSNSAVPLLRGVSSGGHPARLVHKNSDDAASSTSTGFERNFNRDFHSQLSEAKPDCPLYIGEYIEASVVQTAAFRSKMGSTHETISYPVSRGNSFNSPALEDRHPEYLILGDDDQITQPIESTNPNNPFSQYLLLRPLDSETGDDDVRDDDDDDVNEEPTNQYSPHRLDYDNSEPISDPSTYQLGSSDTASPTLLGAPPPPPRRPLTPH